MSYLAISINSIIPIWPPVNSNLAISIKIAGGHIEIMLNIKIAKSELTGGYNGIMLLIEMEK